MTSKPILSVNDLAHRLGTSVARLRELCRGTDRRYRAFPVLKRGPLIQVRHIRDPFEDLKDIQRRIAKRILAPLGAADQAHGGVRGRSPRTNALPHLGKPSVLTIDVRRFFPSIRPAIVHRYFRNEQGYGGEVASILTRLLTLNGEVPQGAPTSMAIANLILSKFDESIVQNAVLLNVEYTRFVDDLAFSGSDTRPLINVAAKLLSQRGLRIHRQEPGSAGKLRVMSRSQPQQVTGLNVNMAGRVSVPRAKRDQVRAAIHAMSGIKTATEREERVRSIQGKIAHIRQFNPGAAARLSRQLVAMSEQFPR